MPYDGQVPVVQQENDALLTRVARLQEDKWMLEEKVTMLEQSGAQMAEEIVAKSKLIQQFCIETGNRRNHTSVARWVSHETVHMYFLIVIIIV